MSQALPIAAPQRPILLSQVRTGSFLILNALDWPILVRQLWVIDPRKRKFIPEAE